MSDLLVWIDCEMTGLDLRRDALIEVAVVIKGREWARAAGRSKKAAEQQAASMAAFLLDGADLDDG